MDKKIGLVDLFFIFFKINLFTFGGGYTIVPVIKDEFVEKRNLIDNEEMLDIIAIAQSGPGPMAINTSILTGFRVLGYKGGIISGLSSTLPCLIIISILYYMYAQISNNHIIKSALSAMSGAVCAILFITVFNMTKNAISKHKVFGTIIFISAFIIGYLTEINTVYIIISSGLMGFITFSILENSSSCTKKGGKDD